jgi:hypothetical protein
MIRPLFLAPSFVLMSATAQGAQVIFTINGFVTSSAVSGYAVNDPITITYTVSSPSPMTTWAPGGTDYQWSEELTSEPEIFTNVSFTGSSGTWTRTTNSLEAPKAVWRLLAGLALSVFRRRR